MESSQPLDIDHAPAAPEERVIVVGPQFLLLPVLALAFAGGGWFLGRTLAARRQPPPAPMAAAPAAELLGSPNVSQADAAPFQIVPAGGADALTQGIDPDRIFPLSERYHPLIGQPAPSFVMKRLDDGSDVDLAALIGQPVLINFWATWCPPCRAEMPWIESVYNEYKDRGLEVLAVDAGEKVPPSMVEETVTRYVASQGLTFPVLMGENTYDVQRDYQVYGLPGTVLVDRSGTVVAFHSGMYPNGATLRDHVQRLLFDGEGGETSGAQPEG